MEIKVYNAYDLTLVGTFPSRVDAETWITSQAVRLNYGMYRTYSMDGWDYFDIGPRTYCIRSIFQ
jgi:hypothetical protein